jgi:uncharacterized protein (TIGR02996 family)
MEPDPFLRRIARRIATDPRDEDFLCDILDNYQDQTRRDVYADWLVDRNDPRGEYVHQRREQTRPRVGEAPYWDELERRRKQIRPLLDPLWLGFVMRERISVVVKRIEADGVEVDFGDGLVGWASICQFSW